MRPRRVAAAGAVLAAAALAAGFVRTTSERSGVPLFWPLPIVPFHVNPATDPASPNTAPSCDPSGSAGPAIAAIRAGFSAWAQPCTDLQVLYAGTLPEIRSGALGSDESVVVIRDGWCSGHPLARSAPCMTDPEVDCGGIYNCFEDTGRRASHGIVALTSVLHDPSTGRIFDADIELIGWGGGGGSLTNAPNGWYFTCLDPSVVPATVVCTTYGQPGCHYMDLLNTVTHEAGHFVGLAHPCDEPGTPACTEPVSGTPYAERTMHPMTAPGETTKRSLSADDSAGVCTIYPSTGGGCGCGAGEGGAAATLLLAALALRRRRGDQVTRSAA